MRAELTFAAAGRILEAGRSLPFLCELREGEGLHITLCGAIAAEAPGPSGSSPPMDPTLARCTPIGPEPEKKLEIVFEDYLLYQVRNESFCTYDPDEVRTGRYLAVFTASKLLDRLTTVLDPGLLSSCDVQHYGIITQDQVIDVIAATEPKVYR